MEWQRFDRLIDAALEEDAARADVTTLGLVPQGRAAEAEVRAGGTGVICGLPLARRVAERFDGRLAFEARAGDGDRVRERSVVARLEGPARSMLSVERTMLNFLQRLSGVATLTAAFVEAVEGTGAGIYDTRKTTPGWRELEKYAVRCGGGHNHRMDLAAMALIKDNHLALLAGEAGRAEAVRRAVERVREASPEVEVEVEVEDAAQLGAALAAGPDVIMLDNMSPEQVRGAVALVRRRAAGGRQPRLEASGSIDLGNVRQYAEAGADMISVGALTHSAPALNVALELVR
ncbi:MAG: carboxylating nicotinate-nucleotide diphosphorylase [Planctomycetota bacterium]|jgi:nicotinate-nucleotide pyrophosphorylase (carboxylating)